MPLSFFVDDIDSPPEDLPIEYGPHSSLDPDIEVGLNPLFDEISGTIPGSLESYFQRKRHVRHI